MAREAKDQTLEFDFRILKPSGETRWVSHSCTPIYGDEGQWLGRRESNHDITERRKAEARIAHMAHHDGLTNLPNRELYQDRLRQALEQSQPGNKRVAVLCVDLDLFKNVNDSFGHPMGDRLLKMVAERLRSEVRGSNLVARLGGDEFAILLDRTDATAAQQTMTRLRELSPNAWSWGISQVREGDTIESMFDRADQKLYAVKRGRG